MKSTSGKCWTPEVLKCFQWISIKKIQMLYHLAIRPQCCFTRPNDRFMNYLMGSSWFTFSMSTIVSNIPLKCFHSISIGKLGTWKVFLIDFYWKTRQKWCKSHCQKKVSWTTWCNPPGTRSQCPPWCPNMSLRYLNVFFILFFWMIFSF